ncbi:MAG: YlxR family protein [Acidimicrobiales bacterium]
MGCRRVAPASELVRVAHAGGGALGVGKGLKGRGAWLCRDAPGCLELAARRGAFSRALHHPISPGAVDELRRELLAGSSTWPEVPQPPPGRTRG